MNIHPKLCPQLKEVEVEPLDYILDASSIYVEPLTTSDWELLEIFASDLEEGLLLNQISVVYPNQIISLMLKDNLFDGSTSRLSSNIPYASIRVLDETFICSVNECRQPCYRIVADTKIIIQPKPRVIEQPPPNELHKPSNPIRILPTEADFSNEMKTLFKKAQSFDCIRGSLSALIPCPPYFTAWMNPNTLSKNVPGWHLSSENSNDTLNTSFCSLPCSSVLLKTVNVSEGSKHKSTDNRSMESVTVARVVSHDMVPENGIVLNPYLRFQLNASILTDFVTVQLLTESQIIEKTQKLQRAVTRSLVSVEMIQMKWKNTKDLVFDNTLPLWRYPDEYVLNNPIHSNCDTCTEQDIVSATSFLATWNEVYASTSSNDEKDLILSEGSIIPSQGRNGTSIDFVLRIRRSEPARNHEDTNGISHPYDPNQYLIQARELHNLLKSSHVSEKFCDEDKACEHMDSIPSTVNILPVSLPSIIKQSNIFQTIKSIASTGLDSYEISQTNFRKCVRLMITGDEGSGKTHLVLLLAAIVRMALAISTVYVDCRKLQSTQLNMEGMLKELTTLFYRSSCHPSLLILDNLDDLIPNPGGSSSSVGVRSQRQLNETFVNQVKFLSDHLQYLIKSVSSNVYMIVSTCKDQKSLHPKLQTVYGFTKIIPITVFDRDDRLLLFESFFKNMMTSSHDILLRSREFATRTEGYRPRDLQSILKRITRAFESDEFLQNDDHSTNSNMIKLAHECISNYVPLSLQNLHSSNDKLPSISWSNIGGLYKAKEVLHEIIIRPTLYQKIYLNAPISLPNGILLFGPSGCGKSILVPSLAQECNFNIVTCRGPELLDKYIGASEANVRKLFNQAYRAAPCVLFMDEVEALAPRRGTDHTGVTDRVVNQLLTFLDGVEKPINNSVKVFVIAATSRPDKIDPALLRPGRLEKHIFVGFPESNEEWNDIFIKMSYSRKLNKTTKAMIQDSSLIEKVMDSSHNKSISFQFSAADIKAVFDTAQVHAVHRYLETIKGKGLVIKEDQIHIDIEDIVRSFHETRPSLSIEDRKLSAKYCIPFLNIDSNERDEKKNEVLMKSLGLFSLDHNETFTIDPLKDRKCIA